MFGGKLDSRGSGKAAGGLMIGEVTLAREGGCVDLMIDTRRSRRSQRTPLLLTSLARSMSLLSIISIISRSCKQTSLAPPLPLHRLWVSADQASHPPCHD